MEPCSEVAIIKANNSIKQCNMTDYGIIFLRRNYADNNSFCLRQLKCTWLPVWDMVLLFLPILMLLQTTKSHSREVSNLKWQHCHTMGLYFRGCYDLSAIPNNAINRQDTLSVRFLSWGNWVQFPCKHWGAPCTRPVHVSNSFINFLSFDSKHFSTSAHLAPLLTGRYVYT